MHQSPNKPTKNIDTLSKNSFIWITSHTQAYTPKVPKQSANVIMRVIKSDTDPNELLKTCLYQTFEDVYSVSMAAVVTWHKLDKALCPLCLFSYFRFKVGFCQSYKQSPSKLAVFCFFFLFSATFLFPGHFALRHQKAVVLLTELLFSAGRDQH